MPANSKSQPYNLFYNEPYYYFQTDHGQIYSCGFNSLTSRLPPVLGIYDIDIHDFEFFPVDPPPTVEYDPRVSATVVDLLEWYFEENKNQVLIYLCDAADSRPRERQALFTRWHRNSMADTITHQPLVIDAGEFAVYGGMMTRKDFPYPEVVQRELVDRSGELILEKFGG